MSNESARVVVLAAVDATKTGPSVVNGAARFVTTPEVELHVVHVLPMPNNNRRLTRVIDRGRAVLEGAIATVPHTIHPILHLAAGDPTLEVLQVASDLEADLLVVGTQELASFRRLFLGSVVEPLTRRAQCPVFVVRNKDYEHKVVPKIIPPCVDCLATQRETKGAEQWCPRHRETHPYGHVHYEIAKPFARGSMFLHSDL